MHFHLPTTFLCYNYLNYTFVDIEVID